MSAARAAPPHSVQTVRSQDFLGRWCFDFAPWLVTANTEIFASLFVTVNHAAIASGGAADSATDGVVERIAETAVQSRAGLLELRRESADLEEIFLKLTTSEETQATGGAV